MVIWSARRRMRWLAPAVLTVLAVGSGVAAAALATGEPKLPPRTAEQLLTDMRDAQPIGFSGTVVLRSELGLPLSATPDPDGGPTLGSLLAGSRTLRIWYAGPRRFRVALLGALGQSDLIRNGSEVWLWQSKGNRATRLTLPTTVDRPAGAVPGSAKPSYEAGKAPFDGLTSVTDLAVESTDPVAGRAAYELVLTPRQAGTTIRQVRLAVDAEHYLPLRVQVYGPAPDPAFEVRFTSIHFGQPDPEQFRFNPPPGVRVVEPDLASLLRFFAEGSPPTVSLAGQGWASVLVIRLPDGPDAPDPTALATPLPPVSGDWGSGWLLGGGLLSTLLTTDGRLLVGPVPPERLTEIAATEPASVGG